MLLITQGEDNAYHEVDGQPVPINQQLYRFALEKGFHSTKANDMLKELQEKEKILVTDVQTGKPARKKSFYLTGKAGKEIRVVFETK